jgi:hypothetical protein
MTDETGEIDIQFWRQCYIAALTGVAGAQASRETSSDQELIRKIAETAAKIADAAAEEARRRVIEPEFRMLFFPKSPR